MATSMQEMTEIEALIKCLICENNFNNPMILKCQHTLCESCITQLLESKQNRCPSCFEEFFKGDAVVDKNKQVLLGIILKGNKKKKNVRMAERCHFCDEAQYKYKCLHCEKFACEDCSDKLEGCTVEETHAFYSVGIPYEHEQMLKEIITSRKQINKKLSGNNDRLISYLEELDTNKIVSRKQVETFIEDAKVKLDQLKIKAKDELNDLYDAERNKTQSLILEQHTEYERLKRSIERADDEFKSSSSQNRLELLHQQILSAVNGLDVRKFMINVPLEVKVKTQPFEAEQWIRIESTTGSKKRKDKPELLKKPKPPLGSTSKLAVPMTEDKPTRPDVSEIELHKQLRKFQERIDNNKQQITNNEKGKGSKEMVYSRQAALAEPKSKDDGHVGCDLQNPVEKIINMSQIEEQLLRFQNQKSGNETLCEMTNEVESFDVPASNRIYISETSNSKRNSRQMRYSSSFTDVMQSKLIKEEGTDASRFAWPHGISIVNDMIWCVEGNRINILKEDGTIDRSISNKAIKNSRALLQLNETLKVVIASTGSGLLLIDSDFNENSLVEEVSPGSFISITCNKYYVFALNNADNHLYMFANSGDHHDPKLELVKKIAVPYNKVSVNDTISAFLTNNDSNEKDSKYYLCAHDEAKIFLMDINGLIISNFGKSGNRFPGELNKPRLCCMDVDNSVIVADVGNKRLQMLNTDGTWLINPGFQEAQKPWDAILDLSGCVWVLCKDGKKVVKLITESNI